LLREGQQLQWELLVTDQRVAPLVQRDLLQQQLRADAVSVSRDRVDAQPIAAAATWAGGRARSLGLATERAPSTREVQRVAALMQAEIARISRLVGDLLLLAKAERSELLRAEALDLNTYLQELWEGTVPIARRRFELGEVPAGTLRADPHRLAQALRNLLTDAIEHTEAPDGLVRLSVVASDARASAAAAVKQHRDAGRSVEIRFIVDDDGPGIPADQRERVFGRFQRTDAARDRVSGGAGLGLAIVRAIAVAHGGWVKASSSPAGVARVELVLPGFVSPEEMPPVCAG
jgi:two-component system, OmpR family, sensor kinase